MIWTELLHTGKYLRQTSNAKIRKFRKEDINKILEIEEQAFPKSAYSKETFLSYASRLRDHFVVVELGTDVVGYLIFDMSGHIHSTAVRTSYRKRGFGKMLFMHALTCAKKRLWLEVRSKNDVAIEFYKKMGMKIEGRIPNYYGDDDALIMVMNQKK
ncbi:MAG: ribosomal protein S18-alanine N-acetyltransferase [Desulfobacteraceae bacterium]|nr:ribosomal protein S18-alanine N-acetyltransferase [Desulfobacteraceae bacterium]